MRLLVLLLATALLAQLLPTTPTPRINGLLTTRVDPKKPEALLEWNARDIPGATGMDWEVSLGPFPDRNPEKLTEKPLKEGHMRTSSGAERIDLSGLKDGEYFLRCQAVNAHGKPVALASDPVRLMVISGLDRATRTGTELPPRAGVLKLVPEKLTLPLGQVQKFWVPEGSPQATGWTVDGG
ncbi:MAG: hypothetical protein AB1758_36405, partial [Candidatus Eremiobacterota bacterium]